MNVNEALMVLNGLHKSGYGECPIIVVDTRSGATDEASMYSGVRQVESENPIGWECDQPKGKIYVPVFIG